MRRAAALPLALLLVAAPAIAQDKPGGGGDGPRFCPNRPSLGSSACTTEPGHVQLEYGLVDWQKDDGRETREDDVLAGDLQARIGVGRATELQLGWTAFGHVRTRDKADGGVAVIEGVGDVRLGVRQALLHPDAKGVSFGVEPFVTLPTGRDGIGAGRYQFGAIIPVGVDLSKTWSLAFTGEADDDANTMRPGHHAEGSGILGTRYKLTRHVNVYGEFEVIRDEDPDDRHTEALAAASLAWRPTKTVQFDLLAVAGLNRAAPGLRLSIGGAAVF